MMPKHATAAAAVVVVIVTVGATALGLIHPCSYGLPVSRGRRKHPLRTDTDSEKRQSLGFASLASTDVDAPGPEQDEPNARIRSQRNLGAESDRIRVERVIMAPPREVKAAWKSQMRFAVPVPSKGESPPISTAEPKSSNHLLWSPISVIDESEQHVHCQIQHWGAILSWFESRGASRSPFSHPVVESTVRFLPLFGGVDEEQTATSASEASGRGDAAPACRLVWCLDLTTRYAELLRPLARWRMNALVDGVQGRLSEPRLFTRRMRLPTKVSLSSSTSRDAVEEAMYAWLDFVWVQGGGLPIPFAPYILPSRAKEPKSIDEPSSKWLIRRMIVPPGLVESVVSVDRDRHQVCYQVDNPGWFTYQVHTHQGRVRFLRETAADGGDAVLLEWKVEIRPYAACRAAVEFFTEAVVNTLSRNLAVHISDPDAVVRVSPPRGKGKSFASVRKDSWLGGVLASHLSDSRPASQQTLSMFQPWTWGRAKDEPEAGAISIWSNGNLDDL